MPTLYFIRHAESKANVKGILAAQHDFQLSQKGRDDALQIAKIFSVYSKAWS